MFLRQIKDRWYYTINEKDDMGRYHKHEHFGGFTRAEAARAYRVAMREIDRTGRFFEPSSLLYPDFLQEWMEKEVRINLKPNTVDAYENIVDNHLTPAFAKVRLKDITTPMLQDYITDLRNKYARGTLKSIAAVLRSSFRWCVANRRYLTINPMDNVRVPRYTPQFQTIKVFTAEQIEQIFERFPRGNQLHMPCMLSYCTGMRLGECLALRWSNVDLKAHTLEVVGNKYDKTGDARIESPKTASSLRVITFGRKLAAELRAQRLWQERDQFEYGWYYRRSDAVCTEENGKPLTSNKTRYFNLWCREHFGGLSFHSFRHTHATMLIENGLALDYVSKRLGHASVYTTANIYDSITDKREKEALSVMDSIL
ncbi:tyrosine-type recombinase/integrase [Megasphaera vaginalis (ex Bordigoni et al. 2020)]|uniref:tyrosine-type recombinase/integrase n=1 Tax=Megasphaera vaginalis (ex Bordigoni et al. 2020) TaxID=2045301 RepID=UPI000C7B56C8|nr:site-specific integrase [Megasphaera vaginalis (ex Bordigoni et al. 2020)]